MSLTCVGQTKPVGDTNTSSGQKAVKLPSEIAVEEVFSAVAQENSLDPAWKCLEKNPLSLIWVLQYAAKFPELEMLKSLYSMLDKKLIQLSYEIDVTAQKIEHFHRLKIDSFNKLYNKDYDIYESILNRFVQLSDDQQRKIVDRARLIVRSPNSLENVSFDMLSSISYTLTVLLRSKELLSNEIESDGQLESREQLITQQPSLAEQLNNVEKEIDAIIDAKNLSGKGLIHLAVELQHFDLIYQLLRTNVDLINLQTRDGKNPLQVAEGLPSNAATKHLGAIQSSYNTLIELSNDLEDYEERKTELSRYLKMKISDGKQAIHLAAERGDIPFIKWLLIREIRLTDELNDDGYKPYMLARKAKQLRAAEYLNRIKRTKSVVVFKMPTQVAKERTQTRAEKRSLEALCLEIKSLVLRDNSYYEPSNHFNPTTFDPFTDIFICPKDFRA